MLGDIDGEVEAEEGTRSIIIKLLGVYNLAPGPPDVRGYELDVGVPTTSFAEDDDADVAASPDGVVGVTELGVELGVGGICFNE